MPGRRSHTTNRKVKKEAKVYELSGPDVMAVNGFENPERIKIKTGMIKNTASKFYYSFPPHSCTVIEVNVK